MIIRMTNNRPRHPVRDTYRVAVDCEDSQLYDLRGKLLVLHLAVKLSTVPRKIKLNGFTNGNIPKSAKQVG